MPLKPIKVVIDNFQSLEHVEFEICGFTAIAGKSNIGKSAILRAISGSILNIPVSNLVRKDAKYCSVELQSEDWGFKWEKGERNVNRYWVNNKEQPLDKVGFGQTEITENFGFKSIKVGTDSVHPWYASQFHPIFLIDKSGTAITNFISEISRLKVLQDGILINVRQKRRLLDEAKLHEKNIEDLKLKESKLSKLPDLIALKLDLDDQFESIEEYAERIVAIEEFIASIQSLTIKVNKFSSINQLKLPIPVNPAAIDRISKMVSLLDRLNESATRIIPLRNAVATINVPTIDSIDKLDSMRKYLKINTLKKSVKSLESVKKVPSVQSPDKELDKLIKGTNAWKKSMLLKQKVDSLSVDVPIPDLKVTTEKLYKGNNILGRIELLQREKDTLEEQENNTKRELAEIESQLAKIPLCPTCGVPISSVKKPDHSCLLD